MTTQVAQVDAARCTGCGRCISACDLRLFSFETHQWKKRSVMQDEHLCSACGACAARCPVQAVTLVEIATPSVLGEPQPGRVILNNCAGPSVK